MRISRTGSVAVIAASAVSLAACGGASNAHPSAAAASYVTLVDLYHDVTSHGVHRDNLTPSAAGIPGVKAQSACSLDPGKLTLTLWRDAAMRDSGVKLLATEKPSRAPYCLVSGEGAEGTWSVDASDSETVCDTVKAGLGGREVRGTGRGATDDADSSASQTSQPARATMPPAFTIQCYPKDYTAAEGNFTSLADAWAANGQWSSCKVDLSPTYQPTSNDLAAVALYQKFVPSETVPGALGTMLEICADTAKTDDDILNWQPVVVQGALLLCPTAPQAGVMRPRADGSVIEDGTYVVGQEMRPGTWSTAPGVQNCYWERTDGGGNTIANNFINFAPNGVTVTVRASDAGFVSQGCGTWHRAD